MATPQRPGWYPAPDGGGTEQWWNGASWSDAKRGVGGAALPGLPTYRATPPPVAPGAEAMPPLPSNQPPQPTLQRLSGSSVNLTSSTPTIALVFGLLGIFIFPLLGIVGIVLGTMVLRRPGTIGTQRTLAIGGIVTGIVALVWGAIQVLFLVMSIVASLQ
jgi:hypothetical protein